VHFKSTTAVNVADKRSELSAAQLLSVHHLELSRNFGLSQAPAGGVPQGPHLSTFIDEVFNSHKMPFGSHMHYTVTDLFCLKESRIRGLLITAARYITAAQPEKQ
jgi:hypothetical protein